jgi:hypothetical protein
VITLWAVQGLCGIPVFVLGRVPLAVLAAVWIPVALLVGWYALRAASTDAGGT